MDWLKDKKNQPIVAAGAAVVIIGAVAALYFTMFAGGSPAPPEAPPPSDTGTATPTTDPSAGYPPGTPATDVGYPGAPGTGTTPGQVAAAPAPIPPGGAVPMEVWRADPFLPAGYKPPDTSKPKPKPPIRDLPMLMNFSQVPKKGAEDLLPDLVQPVRRMSGLIVSDRIYAIIETVGGLPQVVQPGDMLEDRKAKVERIERDKVILKTADRVPKYITVRMASAPRSTVNVTPSTSGGDGRPPSPIGPSDRGRRPYDRGAGAGEPMAPM